MAASRLCSAAAIAAAFTSMSMSQNRAYADSRFRFPFYSSSPPPSDSPANQSSSNSSKSKPEADEPKGSGFDPESLERAAKALRDINSSPHSKQVFDLMRKQEKTRLAELAAETSHYEAIQAHRDIERQQKLAEDQRNLLQTQAQTKAQILRYEDELARKRQQTDHEAQRHHNVELVKMQEASSIRKERAKIATEEQIQAQQRQTEKERAELERETIRVKAMAEAEGRAHEAKLTEEQNRRLLMERINGEREKWLAAINTMFSHIEGGFRTLLTDRNKLIMTVGGATALAAGIYTTRMLGQPSLIRESSMGRFPWAGSMSQLKNRISGAAAASAAEGKKPLDNVILHTSLKKRIEHLARATANTKSHQAPFRNMMFYGPPGTGKTMVAREIARKSGLDYAMMTGGDVAPLGSQAVTKIHQIFDWAKKSNKGLLLFIDEADAFLCRRNSTYMSEAQRSALNALLFRTGDQSRDIVLVLATNRPGDLDSAVTDRIDEVIEFPLPGEEERFKLLNLYLNKYLKRGDNNKDTKPKWSHLFKKLSQKITVEADLTDKVISEAAKKTEGFSGREIAKLVAGVQAGVYGREDCVLDSQLFKEIVEYKVEEHHQRLRLASEGFQPLLFS
ncbi:AAA-type ATPase family protein [Arabidopsis lyrata subsp. lyrata]|uniref:AAA-type ATPase family protein n=1 Tax=Arabidopsis lyrata subsp. lyrata TaxID=81972 RepID=D7MBG4_ARALL|nr:AAA-type ATPase family protein [Arabidopsis lyrata subsp. lyrata]